MFAFIKYLWKRFMEDDYLGIAAQLAYFFLLSLLPLLIFIATLFPYLPITQNDLIGLIRDFAPASTIDLLEKSLSEISKKNTALLSFGIIGTVWSASNGINSIMKVLNRSYDVKEERSFIKARFMAILLTIAMIIVIVLALILPVFGRQIGLFLFSRLELSDQFLTVWNALRWIVSPIIICIIFTGLYWLAPSKKFSCRKAIPGAIFTTIGWIVTSFAFSYYVSNFWNYSATYGSIGAIIVLMIWFYITGIIIIFGGDLNAFISKKEC